MTTSKTLRLIGSVVLISGMVTTLGATQTDSSEINKLLSDAKQQAIELQRDSGQIATFTRSNVTWQGYATQLHAIREHINATGRIVADLNAARSKGSPWQQTAIDRIQPLLKELAGNTETTIKMLNNHQGRVHMKPFQDYVQANYEMATDLTKVIADFVDYGNAKAKFERLAAKLEID